MTNKHRGHAVLAGVPADRWPVTSLYNHLYLQDHFSELTGLPSWRLRQWLASTPEEHVELYARMLEQAPFEMLQPQSAPPREWRERQRFFEKDGVAWRVDTKTGETSLVAAPKPGGHANDYAANETPKIFDQSDVKRLVKPVKAEQMLRDGRFDYVAETARRFGKEHFIIAGGSCGILWACVPWLGQTNMLMKLVEAPALIDELSKRLLEQELENIRAHCSFGADAFFIDDAMCYGDIISPEHYERFSLPYLKQIVSEIHAHRHKAILLYFGNVMDRLEQIVSTGADGFSMETAMKNYSNDISVIADKVGKKITLFGNIDPIGVLQNGSDEDLAREIERQAVAGRKCRGFVLCTGSPITPGTPISRVQRFLELGQKVAAANGGGSNAL